MPPPNLYNRHPNEPEKVDDTMVFEFNTMMSPTITDSDHIIGKTHLSEDEI